MRHDVQHHQRNAHGRGNAQQKRHQAQRLATHFTITFVWVHVSLRWPSRPHVRWPVALLSQVALHLLRQLNKGLLAHAAATRLIRRARYHVNDAAPERVIAHRNAEQHERAHDDNGGQRRDHNDAIRRPALCGS